MKLVEYKCALLNIALSGLVLSLTPCLSAKPLYSSSALLDVSSVIDENVPATSPSYEGGLSLGGCQSYTGQSVNYGMSIVEEAGGSSVWNWTIHASLAAASTPPYNWTMTDQDGTLGSGTLPSRGNGGGGTFMTTRAPVSAPYFTVKSSNGACPAGGSVMFN